MYLLNSGRIRFILIKYLLGVFFIYNFPNCNIFKCFYIYVNKIYIFRVLKVISKFSNFDEHLKFKKTFIKRYGQSC